MRAAFVVLGLVLLASPVLAQTPSSTCVTIEDDAERLACYDTAHGRTPRAAPALPPPASAETPPPERRNVITGVFGDDDAPATVAPRVPYEIASIARRADGRMVFAMSNGEVWAATERVQNVPARGERVVIQRESVAQSVLIPETGVPFRVRKQN